MPDDRSTVRADTAVRAPGGPPLLASRLAPAVPGEPTVLRPRLARLLDEAVSRPVTLLRAPAGWGKTTLLATWRRTRQEADPDAPVPAWVSVEAGDDPDRLWSYLGAALRSVVDPAETPLPDRAPRPDELEILAAALAARERSVVLIVDDLHRITEPAALAGLEFLLRHSEQRLRLVAAGRSGPPLAVHRLRLAGELTEIGPDDLAFTGDEIADLLTAHGVAVPAAPGCGSGPGDGRPYCGSPHSPCATDRTRSGGSANSAPTSRRSPDIYGRSRWPGWRDGP